MGIKIGINTSGFILWGGGVDFIRIILKGLMAVKERHGLEIEVFITQPKQDNSLKPVLRRVIWKLVKLKRFKPVPPPDISKLEEVFFLETHIRPIFCRNQEEFLDKSKSLDIIFPFFELAPKGFSKPWLGYIYDFQHKYYPGFFNKKESLLRDAFFHKMLTLSKALIVNSKAVASDAKKFFPSASARVYAMPFCPLADDNSKLDAIDISEYKLPTNYFLISNQFWIHKDHKTAFLAFAEFITQNPELNFKLVCTGAQHDYRNPGYLDELIGLINQLGLSEKVILLGFIPKSHQRKIMWNARALVQPTLFEGGPGGGSVFEAVSMGIPVVMSDIPVNLEIQGNNEVYFKTGDSQSLAQALKQVLNLSKLPIQEVEKRNKERQIALGDFLVKVIQSQLIDV
ncbi:MAG: glycosyltransferase family 4 protein [Bacteroidia bacterium]|nr:glycosyltransferase family 4 protein [Bacteroidia bacterium]